MPLNAGSRRSSHAIKQLSVQKDSSFEEEEESEEEGVSKIETCLPFSNEKQNIVTTGIYFYILRNGY